jgi:formylglycine-generating enzyme required for sulfatase activity
VTPIPTLGVGSTTNAPVDGAVIVYVPAGEFTMGSDPETDPFFWGAESPSHQVHLDAFWIYRTEVTNGMYAACVEARPCNLPKDTNSLSRANYYGDPQYENYPVISVTWYQARNYCQWAGGRLPSEAEWEKAARGTDGRLFPWGDQTPNAGQANFCDRRCSNAAERDSSVDDGYADTAPVGNYPSGASPYGALDMAGNVWEWVADWHQVGYYRNSPYENPPGPAGGDRRGFRGGSWFNGPDGVRTVARSSRKPGDSYYSIGFRCVVDVP